MSGAPGRSMRILAIFAALLAAGCASGPQVPQWHRDASQSLERATTAWLVGDSRVEALEFTRARAQLARTGQPAVVAQAELLRCATRVATLAFDGCPAFEALAADATAAQLAYARYLRGEASADDVARLPESQRTLVAAGPSASALTAAADPLSALVAAGVAQRRGEAGAAIAAAAVDHASRQGWRRPLLAWLMLLQRSAEAAGDAVLVQRIGRQLDLLGPARADP